MKKEDKKEIQMLTDEINDFVWKTDKGLISMHDMEDDYLVKAFHKCQHRQLRATKSITRTLNKINSLKKKLEIETANLNRAKQLQKELQTVAEERKFIIQDIKNENFELIKNV